MKATRKKFGDVVTITRVTPKLVYYTYKEGGTEYHTPRETFERLFFCCPLPDIMLPPPKKPRLTARDFIFLRDCGTSLGGPCGTNNAANQS